MRQVHFWMLNLDLNIAFIIVIRELSTNNLTRQSCHRVLTDFRNYTFIDQLIILFRIRFIKFYTFTHNFYLSFQ